MSDNCPVRVRIAPSPTGDPHVGTAYIALFNMVFARRHEGRFILRIEDTDQARSTLQSEEAIYRSLKWLGLTWDEGPDVGGEYGPYRQSERKETYLEYARRLIESGHAYHCFCDDERVNRVRAEQRELTGVGRYDGHCRAIALDEARARVAAGEQSVVRLKMPQDGETVLDCPLRGPIAYPNSQQNDQVLLKTDGFPTYHLANVVDDHLMEITHVIRAEEWIPSTPKHLVLYRSFGWRPPTFIHMPILRNRDRSKISKRRNPTSLDYYRRAGILPEAMVNFLANLGYSFGDDIEKFTLAEFIEGFAIERVSLGGPVFDLDKLDWLNGLYLRDLSHEDLLDRVMTEVLSRERLAKIVPLIRERIVRLEEFVPKTEYFFSGALDYDPALLVHKKLTREQVQGALAGAVERLDSVLDWRAETLEETLREFAAEVGIKAGPLFMGVRVAVTGRTASPGLFETMEVLGRPICLFRVRDALRKLTESNGKDTAPSDRPG